MLPPLGNTLEANPASLAAAALAAAPKKPGAKGGKGGKGGAKKKGVKFAGEEDGSPAKSGRTGAASHSQQRATSGGGSGTTQTHSGGTSTTQAGVVATQGVAVAVAGGLGRLAQERAKERSLLLPVLATLGVGAAAAQEQPCYAALPSAAYVLADLHGCAGVAAVWPCVGTEDGCQPSPPTAAAPAVWFGFAAVGPHLLPPCFLCLASPSSKLKAVLVSQKRSAFPGRPSKQQLPAGEPLTNRLQMHACRIHAT